LGEIGTATDQQSNLWTNNIADTGFIAIGYPNPTNVTAVNGYGVKPLFENPTTNPATAEWGFELQSKSPALGAGLLLNFAVTDSAGTSLAAGAKINMGAFVH
jgi:hypothetical protein